jgi:hypothetical protein
VVCVAAQAAFGEVYCRFDTLQKGKANAVNREKRSLEGQKIQVAPVDLKKPAVDRNRVGNTG